MTNQEYYYYPFYRTVYRVHSPCLNDKSEIYKWLEDSGGWIYLTKDQVYDSYQECIKIVVNNFKKDLLESCNNRFAKVIPWK